MTASTDKCCRCACYPNGCLGVFLAQVLLFCGAMFSAATMGDCQLVTGTPAAWLPGIPENDFPPFTTRDPDYTDLVPNNGRERAMGFFFWEMENGKCSWNLLDDDIPEWWLENLWELYFEYMIDSQWRMAMVFSSIATFLGWWLFVAVCFLSCVSHNKSCRIMYGTFITMVLVCFQCLAFVVYRSNFCEHENDCQLGRTGWYAIAAAICYFLAALCFCLVMKDFPGGVKKSPAVAEKGNEHDNDDPEAVVVAMEDPEEPHDKQDDNNDVEDDNTRGVEPVDDNDEEKGDESANEEKDTIKDDKEELKEGYEPTATEEKEEENIGDGEVEPFVKENDEEAPEDTKGSETQGQEGEEEEGEEGEEEGQEVEVGDVVKESQVSNAEQQSSTSLNTSGK